MSHPQDWSAEGYAANARFVSDLGATILGWLDPQPGERILDVGCGDGALTRILAQSGAEIVGVDASEPLLAAARAHGLDVRLMDGQALEFDGEFDAVFSNAALHWMTKPQAVLAGIARALRPGGRFVAEFGGFGNVAAIASAMRAATLRHGGDASLANPWFFPTPKQYAALAGAAGLAVERTELVPRPTPLPTGIRGWLATFRAPFFEQYEPETRERVLDEVVWTLEPHLRDADGVWTADYVRLRVQARRPAGAVS